MKTKICSKCKIEKPQGDFYFRKDEKRFRVDCKNCVLKRAKNYYGIHKEKCKDYYKNHKKEILTKKKIFYIKNRERLLLRSIEYRKTHKKERAIYKRNRMKNNIRFRLSSNLRTRLCAAMNRRTKSLPSMFLIGCEIDYYMYYLQNKFKRGMNWDNYGKGDYGKQEWNVDHIKPCCSFDLSKPEEQRKCFHYTNLQPLWAVDNRRKLTLDKLK